MQCELEKLFDFIYRAEFDNNLIEHELDHVMVGYYNDTPQINPEEVSDWKWMSLDSVKKDIEENPKYYTEWFKIIFKNSFEQLVLQINGTSGVYYPN